MSMQSKPASAIHLPGILAACVFAYLARPAEVHHAGRLTAGNIVPLQKSVYGIGRRRKLRRRFWPSHLVSESGNVNFTSAGPNGIDLLMDGGGMHGAQRDATDVLTSVIVTNGTGSRHGFSPKTDATQERGGSELLDRDYFQAVAIDINFDTVAIFSIEGASVEKRHLCDTPSVFVASGAIVWAVILTVIAHILTSSAPAIAMTGQELTFFEAGKEGNDFGFGAEGFHQVSPGCEGRGQSPSLDYYIRPIGPMCQ
jgi:hypothetical protein